MRPHHSKRFDDGMSLVETVVAMMVFAVFSLLAVAYLVNAQQVGASNTRRVAAANLAAQQIEVVRSSRTLDLPDGTTVLPAPVLSGTTYTLTQQVRFVSGPDGASVCTGGNDRLAYKLVTVSVTWPGMGAVKPVRSDTLKTLGIGATQADARKGSAAVAVVDHLGAPRAGVAVQLTPAALSATTGADGCVVFPNLPTGVQQTARLSAVDHVGLQGDPNPTSSPFSVTAGKVIKVGMSYAPRAALSLTATAPQAGFPVPATLGITVDGANLLPNRRRGFEDCSTTVTAPQNCVQGTPRLASALFPGVYEAWAGRCADARPTTPQSATASTPAAAVTSALGGVRLTLTPTGVTNLTGRRVYAEHAADVGCPGGVAHELSTSSATERRLSLPIGTWVLVARNADMSEFTRSASFTVAAGAVTERTY